jgi:hypothetical protein
MVVVRWQLSAPMTESPPICLAHCEFRLRSQRKKEKPFAAACEWKSLLCAYAHKQRTPGNHPLRSPTL